MKIVHIFSGGLDSTCLLAELLDRKFEVRTISFIYGSKHNSKEILAARSICKYYKLENDVYIYLPFINSYFKSNLLESGGEIPNGHYADDNMEKTIVPFRNGIFLSIATGYAESIGFDTISTAVHAGDHTVYPDCRPAYIRSMDEAIYYGTDGKVGLLAPYKNLSKWELLTIGFSVGAPIELSWSCYKGENIHCGTCGTCIERKVAFKQAGIEDPTKYQS